MEADFLPPHLRKYVVTQNYEKYTPVDQAVWRYILRQLRAFLSVHAHESYSEGLKKTGIEIECIPRIEDISRKLQAFGWRALPVSGFIPPAAFMELQSLGVLPIASDMRTLDHLLYTPAPDIVHEAAGHAPILIQPEFAEYLRQYAQVAKKAIISKEDIDMYEAIRDLSDIKENPTSTPAQIQACEEHLAKVSKNISHISEAAELSRMNWWTAEYGLIGDLKNPKLYGAGLLSSLGESRACLSDRVKKIPLTVDCIKTTYDITEQQPQLFVTPDFKTLVNVLDDMAQQMAFRLGGLTGLQKAIQAKSVNTAELNSGVQISGIVADAMTANGQVVYLKFQGPTQICYKDKQLPGHNKEYHGHGFGTPVGNFKKFPDRSPSDLTDMDWQSLGAVVGSPTEIEYVSGVKISGTVKSFLKKDGRTLLLTLEKARAEFQGQILFDPSWGTYDVALGHQVTSVFGGAADREAYGEVDDFVAKKIPAPKYSETEIQLHRQYQLVRDLREKKAGGAALENALNDILNTQDQLFKNDWLLRLEVFELVLKNNLSPSLKSRLEKDLQRLAGESTSKSALIHDGLALAAQA